MKKGRRYWLRLVRVTREKKILLLWLLSIGAAIACPPNAWVNLPSPQLASKLFQHKLLENEYALVEGARQDIALKKLTTVSFVELPSNEVLAYSSGFNLHPGKKYYLVRGLFLGAGSKFTIYAFERSLYVFNGALGVGAAPRCAALIVESDVPLRKVYVGYTVAQ